MADYYLHKTAAHIDELLEKVEGLNNYDDTEVRGLINNKVDKETGKGLSANDFTDAYKTAVDEAAPLSILTPMTQAQYDALVTKTAPLYFIYEDGEGT